MKKLLSKSGSLNPGAEVPKCEDQNECDRTEILYGMTLLLKDLFIRVTDKSLTREALDEARENFETLKKMYAPCTCKNDACAKLREEREAYIGEVARALENAERFLPSDPSEARTSEMFLSSKPKTFSPSKPKKTKSVSIQTDINRQFFEKTEAERQKFSEQIENSKKETEALKDEIATLEQMNVIQGQEGNKTEEANQKLLEQIKGLQEENERLQREKEELRKNLDKATEEFGIIVEAGYKDRKDLREEIDKKKTDMARLQKELQTKDSEKEAKDEQLQKREEELRIQQEENRQLILQNLINELEEGQTDNKKNDGKKKGEGKKLKKPIAPKTAKAVDDFRKRLKEAGDNRKMLRLLQDELENKHHLKKWVSDDLGKAIENAEERKKEALEAEKETSELK